MKVRIKESKSPTWFAWMETKPQWDSGGKLVGVKYGKVFPGQVVDFYDPSPFFSEAAKATWKKHDTPWHPPEFAEPVCDEAKAFYAKHYPDQYGSKTPKAVKKTPAPKAAADGPA